ncbi:uncharacterized protein LOC126754631 isoform X1 [Bactrocera neohumeralis]|uniref:uncharacterized protein LOC126754631 isoform X1 n=1 Tax=Bactrocera neohumeralis TaxID=98809 RepID=UPI002165826C|nr:uncharacterized protein LOC126754631 isoform X1 [Bactrocera neohumeralis]XP_050322700.1 uncharacterized protein LOC126754631 isoform X1 [Bactrocera neohumeralis]
MLYWSDIEAVRTNEEFSDVEKTCGKFQNGIFKNATGTDLPSAAQCPIVRPLAIMCYYHSTHQQALLYRPVLIRPMGIHRQQQHHTMNHTVSAAARPRICQAQAPAPLPQPVRRNFTQTLPQRRCIDCRHTTAATITLPMRLSPYTPLTNAVDKHTHIFVYKGRKRKRLVSA